MNPHIFSFPSKYPRFFIHSAWNMFSWEPSPYHRACSTWSGHFICQNKQGYSQSTQQRKSKWFPMQFLIQATPVLLVWPQTTSFFNATSLCLWLIWSLRSTYKSLIFSLVLSHFLCMTLFSLFIFNTDGRFYIYPCSISSWEIWFIISGCQELSELVP